MKRAFRHANFLVVSLSAPAMLAGYQDMVTRMTQREILRFKILMRSTQA